MKTFKFPKVSSIALIRGLALSLALASTCFNLAWGGGRSGTGGQGPCRLTSEQLREAFPNWDGKYDEIPAAPPVSRMDPTTRSEPSPNGCAIPIGELDVKMPVVPQQPDDLDWACVKSNTPEVVYERRIAPVEGCRSLQIWSFVRSLENQKKFHNTPEECKSYNADGENKLYGGYNCSKIPFFPTRQEVESAKAEGRLKGPYAYRDHGKVIIEYGQLFFTTTREIVDSKAVKGKVKGKLESTIDQDTFNLASRFYEKGKHDEVPGCAISVDLNKGISCALPGNEQDKEHSGFQHGAE